MRNIVMFWGIAAAIAAVEPAAAEPPAPKIQDMITPAVLKDAQAWINTDIVRVSIQAQNHRLTDLNQAKIDALDNQWKAERESDDKPLISATLSNPLSVYLSRMQGRSLGLFAEIFVMDKHGLNVGQSSITSDFWQGDEGKFQKTFDVGPEAVFIDEPEWDDDNKIWRGQVSFTINDTDGKTEIGAVTLEYNLTELQRRQAAGS
ncbi:hypothetical protein [Rhizobium halophytocola]|uniref:DUF3251 domain-containing protein n=1 Tax=Rhizobium halophytocola TaxID=735519 RepID=A0ABS4E6I4_9HYPH|nr:hypothetical protein [Rhizobium halophytocola]MBP1853554.1 hypothetical protein [Rhizobium halophytocola]